MFWHSSVCVYNKITWNVWFLSMICKQLVKYSKTCSNRSRGNNFFLVQTGQVNFVSCKSSLTSNYRKSIVNTIANHISLQYTLPSFRFHLCPSSSTGIEKKSLFYHFPTLFWDVLALQRCRHSFTRITLEDVHPSIVFHPWQRFFTPAGYSVLQNYQWMWKWDRQDTWSQCPWNSLLSHFRKKLN